MGVTKTVESFKELDIARDRRLLPAPTSGGENGMESVKKWLDDSSLWNDGVMVSTIHLFLPNDFSLSTQCPQQFHNINVDTFELLEPELEASGMRCASYLIS
jgi:hypothetical protein